jgi:hypothetical protein
MRDFIILGPGPADEEWAQIDQPDYRERARAHCVAYINQLRRQFGLEPEGAKLDTLSLPIPAGSGFTVVCYYELDNEEALAYAERCRDEALSEWDFDAKFELTIFFKRAFNPES